MRVDRASREWRDNAPDPGKLIPESRIGRTYTRAGGTEMPNAPWAMPSLAAWRRDVTVERARGARMPANRESGRSAACGTALFARQGAHRISDRHRVDADTHDLRQQRDHRILVIGEAVAVEFGADGGVLDRLFLVLIEYPVDRRTIAEAIGPGFGRDAGQLRVAVHDDDPGFGLAAQLGHGCAAARIGRIDAGQLERLRLS